MLIDRARKREIGEGAEQTASRQGGQLQDKIKVQLQEIFGGNQPLQCIVERAEPRKQASKQARRQAGK